MKEFYIAPEVKRLAFLPQEELASVTGNFDDLLGGGEGGNEFGGGKGSVTQVDPGDVDILV